MLLEDHVRHDVVNHSNKKYARHNADGTGLDWLVLWRRIRA
jgi:hypothetical protein